LKYILADQVFEVTFEGQKRRFCIASVNTQRGEGGGGDDVLVDDLSRLSLGHNNSPSSQQLWIVGWDTNVQIVAVPAQQPPSESHHQVGF
jgi:hypothetical protein